MRDSEKVMFGLDTFKENQPTSVGNSMSLSDFVFYHFRLLSWQKTCEDFRSKLDDLTEKYRSDKICWDQERLEAQVTLYWVGYVVALIFVIYSNCL